MNRTSVIIFAVIGVSVALLVVLVFLAVNEGEDKVFAVGVLDHYEYVPGLRGNRATVIYFSNGTSFVMQGDHYSVSYPPGTLIKIVGVGGRKHRIMPINSQ